uniref:Uncharacterized protein n=1 Tax=Cannabis sativa TaxID=3483 RepID=A0A803P2T8_CANSA
MLDDGCVAKFSERLPVLGVKRRILPVSSIHGVAPKGKKGMTGKMAVDWEASYVSKGKGGIKIMGKNGFILLVPSLKLEVVSDVASDVVADKIGVGSLGSPVGMNNDVGVISIDLAEVHKHHKTVIDKKLKDMAILDANLDQVSCGELRKLEKELDVLHEKDEKYWASRAKSNWLKLGDKNTFYFHKCASSRKKKNRIAMILNSDGVSVSEMP